MSSDNLELMPRCRSPGSKKDDEAMYDTGGTPTGASGKVTGEGSHFGSAGTGTDSAGYSLGKSTTGHGYSAAEPEGPTDSSGYSLGKGPQASGELEANNHINTATAEEEETDEYPGDRGGQAAIGQTSTYSSHPLATGDKTSSVVDPSSSDPTTFKKPETSNTGFGPDAAEIAAKRAYNHSSGHMPGEYPTEDSSNPYAASSLDPRVDSTGHAPTESHTGRDTALGVGAGAAGLGAYEASKHDEPQSSSTAAPSTLTSTTDPTERPPAYGSATESRSLDSTTPATATTDDSTQKKTMVGTVLGALGLGGGAAAAKHEADKESTVNSTPSTTTGIGSYSSPSQSGPPPSHHRKESIPTTAYPSGNLESVKPIAGPTGQAPTQGSPENYGRNAAIGAGIGPLGAHEYEKNKGLTAGTSSEDPMYHDTVTSDTSRNAQSTTAPSGPGAGLAASATTTGPVAPGAKSSATTGDETHHHGRDAVVAGVALGAAGFGAHEYEKSGTSGVTPTSQQYGNQPITPGTSKDFSSRVDPRTDAAGIANQGTGVGAVPTTASQQPEDEHHYGRDATLVGGGAVAAGYGAHEISEHDAKKTEKEHNKLQKAQTKEVEKEQKAQEKELKKEQKAEEKAEKKQQKAVAKEEKKQEKAMAKEEKKQEKEAAKVEKQHEKALEKDEKRHKEEGAAAIGAGAVGAGGAYEYEKHEQPPQATGGGLAAADAANSGTEHYDRDAAIGVTGATAIGAGAYEAEKHDESSQMPTTTGTTGTSHDTDPYYTRHPVPDSAVEDGTTGRRMSRLEAADAIDRKVYGGTDPAGKKPSLFKRIFKRKKNATTGESEDDEENYEDVPQDQHEDATATTGATDSPMSTGHVQGEMVKPSYNPFKKEVASDYGPVTDRK
jgi:hypothetical protein